MEFIASLPFLEIAVSASILIGGMMGFMLFLIKYPVARCLGGVLCAWQLIWLPQLINDLEFLCEPIFVFLCITIYEYVLNFFSQKSRTSYWHLITLSVMLAAYFGGNGLIEYVSWALVATYFTLVLNKLKREGQERGFSWFSNSGSRLVWFKYFLTVNSLSILILLFAPAIHFAVVSLIQLVIVWLVVFQLVKESGFFSPIPIGNKYRKSTLSPEIKSNILGRISTVMQEEEFYLRDDASLRVLADVLNVSTHHLSQVLNESMQVSFQDLISQYRIRKACQILKAEESTQVKIENIANRVGYNSKSAFNTAFKRKTGLTPSQYRDQKDVQTYREEHLPGGKEPSSTSVSVALNHVSPKLIPGMIQHFLILFGRNIKRNSLFAFLNLFGLTVGFTCSVLIYLFLENEVSYDQWLPGSESIYRVTWISDNPQTRTPHPMAQALVNDFPEVEAAVSLSPWYGPGLSKELVRVKNRQSNVFFEEPDFFFADSTFFNVFEVEIVEGDEDALSNPFSLVISETMALKYFGGESAIGKELELNDMPIAVSAVVKPMQANSHFHFNAIMPYVTLKQINPNDSWMTWADFGHFNYIRLSKGKDPQELESKIPQWIGKYLDWWEDRKADYENSGTGFELQPIRDIHLTSHLRWELENNGNILYVYILSGTLFFLLLIAAINYVNLTTAKSIERAKEVGVRKTLGAISSRISVQFYVESVLFSTFAMLISLVAASLFLNRFNEMAGMNFSHEAILNAWFLMKAIGFSILIGLIAGFYPALILSSFKPTEVLKGKLTTSGRGVRLRSVLVILQFAISAVLISGSLIINRQIDFMKKKDLGFDQDAVISLNIPVSVELGDIDLEKVRVVQNQVESIQGVSGTSLISNLPGGQFNQHAYYLKDNPDNRIDASEVMVDFEFEEVLGIEIMQGRSYDPAYSMDTARNFMVNEEAVRQLNLDNPIGEKLIWIGNNEELEGTIIGVVKDFHYRSLHQPIQPLVMVADPYGAGHIMVKMNGNEFSRIIKEIEPIYEQLGSELPFEYHFLDQQLATLYAQEEQTLSIFSVFSIIALLLASLGLLGMAIAMLNQRIKEVGIRKILGATSGQIMGMILGQFARLVVLAALIGLPVSYFVMQSWMAEFSYRTPIGLMPFVWALIILLSVAILSVISAVTKITFSNPVDSLKYE